jgi:hypothetical protein
MTTFEQKPQSQSSYNPQQSGDDNFARQSQQQSPDTREVSRGDKKQSPQQDEQSFTISADDFMML